MAEKKKKELLQEIEDLTRQRDLWIQRYDTLNADVKQTPAYQQLLKELEAEKSYSKLMSRKVARLEAQIKELQNSTAAPPIDASALKNPKRGRPPIEEPIKAQIRQLHDQGLSIRTIAGAVGVSVGSVEKVLKN